MVNVNWKTDNEIWHKTIVEHHYFHGSYFYEVLDANEFDQSESYAVGSKLAEPYVLMPLALHEHQLWNSVKWSNSFFIEPLTEILYEGVKMTGKLVIG